MKNDTAQQEVLSDVYTSVGFFPLLERRCFPPTGVFLWEV